MVAETMTMASKSIGFPIRECDRNTNRIRAVQEIDREILPKKNVKYFTFMDPKKERKLECRACAVSKTLVLWMRRRTAKGHG
jgi:hypothetical protein